jgi:hypothetical protein
VWRARCAEPSAADERAAGVGPGDGRPPHGRCPRSARRRSRRDGPRPHHRRSGVQGRQGDRVREGRHGAALRPEHRPRERRPRRDPRPRRGARRRPDVGVHDGQARLGGPRAAERRRLLLAHGGASRRSTSSTPRSGSTPSSPA